MKTKIREYSEGEEVEVVINMGRWVVLAKNEGGYNCTLVDVRDFFWWVVCHPFVLFRKKES